MSPKGKQNTIIAIFQVEAGYFCTPVKRASIPNSVEICALPGVHSILLNDIRTQVINFPSAFAHINVDALNCFWTCKKEKQNKFSCSTNHQRWRRCKCQWRHRVWIGSSTKCCGFLTNNTYFYSYIHKLHNLDLFYLIMYVTTNPGKSR